MEVHKKPYPGTSSIQDDGGMRSQWFLDDVCDVCGIRLITDGKYTWCHKHGLHHIASPDCWCGPELTYDDGGQVWVHKSIN